jgi:hypothetical protein
LTGNIPSELGLVTSLSALDLSFGRLNGTIPTTIGALSNIASLKLNRNKLKGELPTELGRLTDTLQDLCAHACAAGHRAVAVRGIAVGVCVPLLRTGGTHSPALVAGPRWARQLDARSPARRAAVRVPLRLRRLLDYNQLQGTLCTELGQLTKLEQLYAPTTDA